MKEPRDSVYSRNQSRLLDNSENINQDSLDSIIKSDKNSISSESTTTSISSKSIALSHKYPYALVWTPIPILSWVFPFIGHVGICSGKGIIHDFSGPYTITRQNMLFGWPTKFVPLSMIDKERYEKSLKTVTSCYEGYVMYNFFTHNCHHYVCSVMNEYSGYGGGAYDVREGELMYNEEMDPNEFPVPTDQVDPLKISGFENHWFYKLVKNVSEIIFGYGRWNIVMIALLIWWYGNYVSTPRKLYTIIPSIITWIFILIWFIFVSALVF